MCLLVPFTWFYEHAWLDINDRVVISISYFSLGHNRDILILYTLFIEYRKFMEPVWHQVRKPSKQAPSKETQKALQKVFRKQYKKVAPFLYSDFLMETVFKSIMPQYENVNMKTGNRNVLFCHDILGR